MLVLVRLCVDYRIKPHAPPFIQIPAKSVKFQPCDCTIQAEYSRVSVLIKYYSTHYLQYRLLGSLILFATYTFTLKLQFYIVKTFRL